MATLMEVDHEEQPSLIQSIKQPTGQGTVGDSLIDSTHPVDLNSQHHQLEEEDGNTANEHTPLPNTPTIPSYAPSCLHTEGYPYSLRILHDRLTLIYNQKAMHLLDVGTVRSNLPIPKPNQAPIWYYELEVQSIGEKNQITIGIAPLESSCLYVPDHMGAPQTPVPTLASQRQHETASLTCRQVGMDYLSYGYRGDKGEKFHGPTLQSGRPALGGEKYGPSFVDGDIIGCGVNYYDSSIFFTRNGRYLGSAFTLTPSDWSKEPSPVPIDSRLKFYAAVSLHSKGEQVKLNFGQTPFSFDLTGFQANEKHRIQAQISSLSIDSSVMLPLIRSYLINQGYEKSLEALNQISNGSKSKPTPSPSTATPMEEDDDSKPASSAASSSTSSHVTAATSSIALPSASQLSRSDQLALQTMSQRRLIRELIEAGDITRAMDAINELVHDLWTNPNRSTMLQQPHSLLILQFRLQSIQFIQLLTNQASPTRLVEAIEFAQTHFSRYQESAVGEEATTLNEAINQLMGLLAYQDLSATPFQHLTQATYREQIADEVNSALLRSLLTPTTSSVSLVHGCSSLEILLRQTHTVETVLQQHGFPLALPNVKEIWAQD